MDVRQSETIEAPAERIFELITDDEKKKEWAEGVMETFYPEGRPDRPVGTRFIQKIKEGGHVTEYAGEILVFDKPHHLAVKMSNRHFDMLMKFDLKPMGKQTRVDFSVQMPKAGLLAQAVGKVFGWFTKMILKKQLAALKVLAEGHPQI